MFFSKSYQSICAWVFVRHHAHMHERTYMCLSVLAINIANADAADAVDINDGIMRERERKRERER